jgi:3-(3-hydroxy-phenyl)propionate hydroxylase
VETASRRREKLDDVIGPWFSVIGVHVDPSCHLSPESLAWWGTLGARLVRVDPPRSGPRPAVSGLAIPLDDGATPAVVVEDVDGAFRDWLLARPGKEVIILRPDRYVAAVCGRAELESTTGALCELLTGRAGNRRAG